MNSEKLKAAAYARFSSDKQSETSIETQLDKIEKHCEEKGYDLCYKYIDRAFSARTDQRPQFKEAVEAAKKKKFDVLIVYKFDRFARNILDAIQYKQILEDNEVKLVSVNETLPEGAAGDFLYNIMSSAADFYSSNQSHELREKATFVAKRGYFMGGTPPYGFSTERVKDPEASRYRKIFVIDEKEAPFVNIMFKMRAEGSSTFKIAKFLNDQNVPTRKGGKWMDTTINDILHNKKYKGTYTYRERYKRVGGKGNSHAERTDTIEIDGILPAIVSTELFDAVQKLHKGRRKSNSSRHLLNGVMNCGLCGSPMYIAGSNRGYYKYECSGYRKNKCNKFISVGETKAEETILGYVKSIIDENKDYEIIAEQYNKTKAMLDIKNTERVIIIQENLSSIEEKTDNALNAILAGVAPQKMENKIKELEQEKEYLLSELRELQRGTGTKISAEEVQKEFERYTRLLEGSFEEKKEVISKFIEQVLIYERGYIKIVGRQRHV